MIWILLVILTQIARTRIRFKVTQRILSQSNEPPKFKNLRDISEYDYLDHSGEDSNTKEQWISNHRQFTYYSSIRISFSIFTKCKTNGIDEDSGFGGAIMVTKSELCIQESSFIGNQAAVGGSISLSSGNLYWLNSIVVNCAALYSGGALCVASKEKNGDSSAYMNNILFQYCKSDQFAGAATFENCRDIYMERVRAEHCSASLSAGAFYFTNCIGYLYDSSFSECAAGTQIEATDSEILESFNDIIPTLYIFYNRQIPKIELITKENINCYRTIYTDFPTPRINVSKFIDTDETQFKNQLPKIYFIRYTDISKIDNIIELKQISILSSSSDEFLNNSAHRNFGIIIEKSSEIPIVRIFNEKYGDLENDGFDLEIGIFNIKATRTSETLFPINIYFNVKNVEYPSPPLEEICGFDIDQEIWIESSEILNLQTSYIPISYFTQHEQMKAYYSCINKRDQKHYNVELSDYRISCESPFAFDLVPIYCFSKYSGNYAFNETWKSNLFQDDEPMRLNISKRNAPIYMVNEKYDGEGKKFLLFPDNCIDIYSVIFNLTLPEEIATQQFSYSYQYSTTSSFTYSKQFSNTLQFNNYIDFFSSQSQEPNFENFSMNETSSNDFDLESEQSSTHQYTNSSELNDKYTDLMNESSTQNTFSSFQMEDNFFEPNETNESDYGSNTNYLSSVLPFEENETNFTNNYSNENYTDIKDSSLHTQEISPITNDNETTITEDASSIDYFQPGDEESYFFGNETLISNSELNEDFGSEPSHIGFTEETSTINENETLHPYESNSFLERNEEVSEINETNTSSDSIEINSKELNETYNQITIDTSFNIEENNTEINETNIGEGNFTLTTNNNIESEATEPTGKTDPPPSIIHPNLNEAGETTAQSTYEDEDSQKMSIAEISIESTSEIGLDSTNEYSMGTKSIHTENSYSEESLSFIDTHISNLMETSYSEGSTLKESTQTNRYSFTSNNQVSFVQSTDSVFFSSDEEDQKSRSDFRYTTILVVDDSFSNNFHTNKDNSFITIDETKSVSNAIPFSDLGQTSISKITNFFKSNTNEETMINNYFGSENSFQVTDGVKSVSKSTQSLTDLYLESDVNGETKGIIYNSEKLSNIDLPSFRSDKNDNNNQLTSISGESFVGKHEMRDLSESFQTNQEDYQAETSELESKYANSEGMIQREMEKRNKGAQLLNDMSDNIDVNIDSQSVSDTEFNIDNGIIIGESDILSISELADISKIEDNPDTNSDDNVLLPITVTFHHISNLNRSALNRKFNKILKSTQQNTEFCAILSSNRANPDERPVFHKYNYPYTFDFKIIDTGNYPKYFTPFDTEFVNLFLVNVLGKLPIDVKSCHLYIFMNQNVLPMPKLSEATEDIDNYRAKAKYRRRDIPKGGGAIYFQTQQSESSLTRFELVTQNCQFLQNDCIGTSEASDDILFNGLCFWRSYQDTFTKPKELSYSLSTKGELCQENECKLVANVHDPIEEFDQSQPLPPSTETFSPWPEPPLIDVEFETEDNYFMELPYPTPQPSRTPQTDVPTFTKYATRSRIPTPSMSETAVESMYDTNFDNTSYNENYTRKFSPSLKFSETELFNESDGFSRSSFFSTDNFTYTVYFSESEDLTQSQFIETNNFSISEEFSRTLDFSPHPTPTGSPTKSAEATEKNDHVSKYYSSTISLTQSHTQSYSYIIQSSLSNTEVYVSASILTVTNIGNNTATHTIIFFPEISNSFNQVQTYTLTQGDYSITIEINSQTIIYVFSLVFGDSKRKTNISLATLIGVAIGSTATVILISLIAYCLAKRKEHDFNSHSSTEFAEEFAGPLDGTVGFTHPNANPIYDGNNIIESFTNSNYGTYELPEGLAEEFYDPFVEDFYESDEIGKIIPKYNRYGDYASIY